MDNYYFIKLKEHSEENLGNGSEESLIQKLEAELNIKFPIEFRFFLKKMGYAEIYGNEIYSIYEIPDTTPCNGLDWMNKHNPYLSKGFIEFFSNDIDGTFYINQDSGKIYLNSDSNFFAESFSKFIEKIL